MKKRHITVLIILVSLGLTACAVRYDNVAFDNNTKRTILTREDAKTRQEINNLTSALMTLGPNVDVAEARLLAHEAIAYPRVLANQYNLVGPPYWHNVLVNYGYRDNGLCWQWTRDMARHIQARNWKSFDFFHGNANRRRYNEHSTLVVSYKGQGVREGIILDPWRHSGTLYWVKAAKDPKYYWTRFIN